MNRLEIKTKRIHLRSKPVELALEPTLKCNSNCLMCNRNFNRKETKEAEGYLSWETFRKVEPFFQYAEKVLFGGFGEPLLHPDYTEMIREIKKSGPFIYLYTNGILMKETIGKKMVDAGVDMISVSMGGATRETYRKIRGIDAFDTVVKNIRGVNEYKKKQGLNKPILSFNIVAMTSLLKELEQIVLLAHEIGITHITFPNLVVQGPKLKDESLWLGVHEAKLLFTRASKAALRLGISFVPPCLDLCTMVCIDLFKKLNVNWDGTVMSCAMERYIIGDLKEIGIEHVWNSPGMVRLRRNYYSHGLKVLCPNCTCWDNRPISFLNPSVNTREKAQRI